MNDHTNPIRRFEPSRGAMALFIFSLLPFYLYYPMFLLLGEWRRLTGDGGRGNVIRSLPHLFIHCVVFVHVAGPFLAGFCFWRAYKISRTGINRYDRCIGFHMCVGAGLIALAWMEIIAL